MGSIRWLTIILGWCGTAAPAIAARGLFPKMPATTQAYVVDCGKDTKVAAMSARALQGLVNRTSAEVYLIDRPWQRQQLDFSGRAYESLPALPGANSGLRTLVQKYRPSVKKLFVYDPDQSWTWAVALMSAAQQDGLPVTESIRDDLMKEFDWHPDVEDFRGRWPDRISACDWALVHLMPGCSRQVIFAMKLSVPLIDYAVASRGFVTSLDFKTEQAEVEKVFKTPGYGVGTSLMGYASTHDEANALSNRFGIGYVVSDLYYNGSFWSSFPNKTYTQEKGKAIKAEAGKIYASMMWSDGDNISFDQNPLYLFWNSKARGTAPVATSLSPTLQELNPPLLDWYYARRTANDELVAGPTGFQFIFIRDYKEAFFARWCKLNRQWCADAGFHSARIWIAPNPSPKFTMYMQSCGMDGLFGEGWVLKQGWPPKIETYSAANEDELAKALANTQPDPAKPLFVNFTAIVAGFNIKNGGYWAIKRQIDRVDAAFPGRYVFLLPKDQFATIQAFYSSTLHR